MINKKPKRLTKLQLNPQIICLREAKNLVCIDTQDKIPFWVWLFENPKSPIALPGNISLDFHDCLHVIFGIGVTPEDEAFVLGLTMGSDADTKEWHIKVFKFISEFLYPQKFRFCRQDLYFFDLGVAWAKKLKVNNLNKIDFRLYEDKTIAELREWLGAEEVLLLLNTECNQPPLDSDLEEYETCSLPQFVSCR